jgi:D-alanyl-D-alanine carboxypeptidase
MLKLSAICFATLILLHGPSMSVQAAPVAAADQAIDASIARYYKATDPGAAIIVTKDGKPLLRKAYGLASVEQQQPMTADMSLRLGSITKQFTAVAILMLAEEGKLSVSDDITKFLPDYPSQGKKITIEHLLTHTSGIVSYTGKPGFFDRVEVDIGVTQMIDSFKNDKLDFEPGSTMKYNNSGYFLLGAIIEKISGHSYAKFVEQRIFTPLKMSQTAYEGHERGATQRAAGHTRAGSGFGSSRAISMSQPYAAGALVSTVDDLARWEAAVAAGQLLKPASWKQAFTPYTLTSGKQTGYGYGWGISTLQGSPMISHGGGINGFSTFALRLPEENVFVAVLSNSDSGVVPPEMVASKAAAIAIGKPFPEYKAITLEPKILDAYAGVYKVSDKDMRTIRREKDGLVLHRPGRGDTALLAHSENGFFIENTLVSLEFGRDAKGEVSQVTVKQGSTPTVYPRVIAAPMN